VAYLVAAAHRLPTDDYTFAYVTGWAAGVDRAEPERVVRDTGARVLAAGRAVLAATQPEATATAAGRELAAGVQAGTERTAAARAHAAATLALAQPAAADPAAAAAELAALARLHADAAAFYTAQLAAGSPDAARATALLTARAVPAAAVAGYEIGYAPPGWTALVDHLRARGYTDAQLLDAGVGLRTRRGTVVDRFRDRLMFPVRDPGGQRVVGFLGRALAEAEDTPRYLNSPATALYRKGEVLYGLGAEPARQALAGGARPVLVEGPLDAIAVTCAGGGRYAGVAPCGTALTAAQVAVLDTHAGPLADRGVIAAFDHDPGGRQAVLRAYQLLAATGAWPTTATLPEGQDPAALTQQRGPDALRATLDSATKPLADLVVDERLARWSDRLRWVEGQLGAARDAGGLIATFPPDQIGRQVLRVADRLGLDPAGLTRAVADAVSRDGDALGRLGRRNRRADLDRDSVTTPTTAARLARVGYPAPLRSVAPGPGPAAGAHTGAAGPAVPPPRQTAGRPR
jgi:DNA primase